MNATSIEWVKNPDGTQGYTWNPITGCLNGCPYCYARRLANGRLRSRYLANRNVAPFPDFIRGRDRLIDPFYPRFWEDRIDDIKPSGAWWDTLRGRQAKSIFVCDMGELFGDWLPSVWQEQVFDVIKGDPLDRFYLLTKQPQNLIKFSPFPDNCWVGISVTNSKQMNDALYFNPDYKAKIKFLSFEPLLERIDKSRLAIYRYDWVIIGAQTKPYKPPKIEWVEEIVEACDKAGIPVFLKNDLLELVNYVGKETEFAFNKDGYYRQEIPSKKGVDDAAFGLHNQN